MMDSLQLLVAVGSGNFGNDRQNMGFATFVGLALPRLGILNPAMSCCSREMAVEMDSRESLTSLQEFFHKKSDPRAFV